jgi:hypothetical protein
MDFKTYDEALAEYNRWGFWFSLSIFILHL